MTAPEQPPVEDTPAGLVVVGGGPAGHAAAMAYREAGGAGRVVLISADDSRPYRRPPLSKDYLRGESEEVDLPLAAPGEYTDRRIEVWLSDPVLSLDPGSRRVRTTSGREIAYQSCVLATGCAAAMPVLDGADHPSLIRLRSLADARFLRTAASGAARAVVIGSGFVGCEAAVSLATRGIAVTMLTTEELPQLDRLGRAVAVRIAGWLAAAGVQVHPSAQVLGIDPDGAVRTAVGRHQADLVLAAVGVTPNSALAAAAGVPLRQGRIVVDDAMATEVAGLYAAGDVAVAFNAAAGRPLHVEHWGDADRMGQIAGRSAAGVADSWADVPGFWSGIGAHTLKYVAWGDGYDSAHLVEHAAGGFTVWYLNDGRTVGVLTHQADGDYERAADLITRGAAIPVG